MKRTFIFFISLCLLSFSLCSFAKPSLSAQLTQVVKQAQQRFDIHAISLAVLSPGQSQAKTYAVGTLSLKSKQAIDANTLFKVGSITKTYTAALLAQAIQEHKISLSDNLTKWLPQYPKWQNVTINDLVNQTSGILDYDATANWWRNLVVEKGKVWKPTALVKLAYDSPMQFKPGHGWAYSNTNYVLLGMILSQAYHEPVSKLIAHLIKQADLHQTYYHPQPYNKAMLKRFAHGYYQNKYDETDMNESWLRSAGAVSSTPNNMTQWLKTVFTNHAILGLPLSRHFTFVNTNNGKPAQNQQVPAYSFGLFRKFTDAGVIYYTPGLTSGYVSMMVYVPKLKTYFAYSASKAPIPGFHKYMLKHVLNILLNNS